MNKNLLIAVGVVGFLLIGVLLFRMKAEQKATQQETVTTQVSPTVQAKPLFAVYEGDLPCADCEGIDTVLTLFLDETYTMSNTYRGRDVAPYIEKGKWTTLRGDATDPDATVYQLYDNGTDSEQNYLLSGNELKQMDKDMRLIDAPFNTSLTKKNIQ